MISQATSEESQITSEYGARVSPGVGERRAAPPSAGGGRLPSGEHSRRRIRAVHLCHTADCGSNWALRERFYCRRATSRGRLYR